MNAPTKHTTLMLLAASAAINSAFAATASPASRPKDADAQAQPAAASPACFQDQVFGKPAEKVPSLQE